MPVAGLKVIQLTDMQEKVEAKLRDIARRRQTRIAKGDSREVRVHSSNFCYISLFDLNPHRNVQTGVGRLR